MGGRLQAVSQARRAELLALTRARKMARSVHAYVRGNTVKFYDWLDASNRCALPDGPPIWICGDCHVGGAPQENKARRGAGVGP